MFLGRKASGKDAQRSDRLGGGHRPSREASLNHCGNQQDEHPLFENLYLLAYVDGKMRLRWYDPQSISRPLPGFLDHSLSPPLPLERWRVTRFLSMNVLPLLS